MKTLNKEFARDIFIENIMRSWTWERMSGEERDTFINRVIEHSQVTGNYNTRYRQYHNLYFAYLLGLGYDGMNWRENEMQTLYAR